jgi:hypothetical protein
VVLEVVERPGDGGGVVEVVGVEDLALDDRVVDLDLVEPAAVDGVWTRIRFAQRPWRRSMDFWPRWSEPLSTIQNTRGAER